MMTKPLDPTRFWMLMGLLPLRRVTGCSGAGGKALAMIIMVSSVGGAQAAGGRSDEPIGMGLLFFYLTAFVVYTVVVVLVTGAIHECRGRWSRTVQTPLLQKVFCGGAASPRTELARQPVRGLFKLPAYWDLELAELREIAASRGIPAARATTKRVLVHTLLENEFPWMEVDSLHFPKKDK